MERRFEACSPVEGVVGEHRLLSQLLGGVNGGDSARHALCAESDTDAHSVPVQDLFRELEVIV